MCIRNGIKTFLKGLLMGGADIIPGVSGGTMALITGIYQRLIHAIKGLTDFIKPLCKGQVKSSFNSLKKIDFGLFIPLGLGIIIAFGIGSLIIPHLLDNYTAYIYAFFFGLILASVKLVYKRIEKSNWLEKSFGLIGFVIAFFVVGLTALSTSPSYWFIFICGAIAITAMLLPGVSGSFMLLMLGQYKFMLEALRSLKLGYIFSFLVGAIISLIISSRILAYLLKKHHSKTMWFLVGLMVGALRLPFEKIVYSGMEWSFYSGFLVALFLVIGIVIVLIVGKYEQ
jgi:putative membrane protein